MDSKRLNSLLFFKTGQVWQLEDSHLRIELVGKTLVHYKQFKAAAKVGRVILANKAVLQAYLKRKKAVLTEK